jgi:hypothetical protein
MNLGLDELRADLLDRWKNAFDRIAEVKAPIPAGTERVYTQYPAFALENYSTKKFKPGARVSRAPSGDRDYVFELDGEGRPLRVRYEHEINRTSWLGAYRYGPDEVELIEVCTQTDVPNLYNRLVLSGDSVLAEQRFVCNAGGSDGRLKNLSTAEKVKHILGDPHGSFIYVTRFHVENGVTRSADEYQEAGGEVCRPRLEYSYADDGRLQRIVQHWPGGESRTKFAAKRR